MQDGNLIATMRNSKNLSQKDMAKLLNVSLNTYKAYENQERVMKIQELNIISNLFDVSLDYLLNLTNKNYVIKKISNEIDFQYLHFSLRYHRRMRRCSAAKLAKEFKVAPATIGNYERYSKNIDINYLKMYAIKFHLSVDYICGKTLKKEILI